MTPISRKQVEEGREANVLRRVEPDTSPETLDAQKAKRSTRSNRLAGGPAFTGVSLVIPFKYLVSDNAKYGVIRGRMLLRADYRAAKDTIQGIARRAMQDTAPTDQPVSLHAKLYMPDARRRDATNNAKILNDSLQGAVYLDDTQIKSATYEHAGIDRENPRCEVTISPRAA